MRAGAELPARVISVGDWAGGAAGNHLVHPSAVYHPLQIAMECFNSSFLIWMCLLPSTKGQSVLNFFAVAFACYKTVPCDFSCLD